MPAELRRAAFIDRDGVVNEEHGYVHRIEDFHFIAGVVEGLLALQGAGYALILITNQAGIAKGMYTELDFHRLTEYMRRRLASSGVHFSGVYFCPHHPQGTVAAYATNCNCRKPAPGMILSAAAGCGLDLSQSVLIGDKPGDVEAGRAAGLKRNILVRSGHALPADAASMADHVCEDLAAAALWICVDT